MSEVICSQSTSFVPIQSQPSETEHVSRKRYRSGSESEDNACTSGTNCDDLTHSNSSGNNHQLINHVQTSVTNNADYRVTVPPPAEKAVTTPVKKGIIRTLTCPSVKPAHKLRKTTHPEPVEEQASTPVNDPLFDVRENEAVRVLMKISEVFSPDWWQKSRAVRKTIILIGLYMNANEKDVPVSIIDEIVEDVTDHVRKLNASIKIHCATIGPTAPPQFATYRMMLDVLLLADSWINACSQLYVRTDHEHVYSSTSVYKKKIYNLCLSLFTGGCLCAESPRGKCEGGCNWLAAAAIKGNYVTREVTLNRFLLYTEESFKLKEKRTNQIV